MKTKKNQTLEEVIAEKMREPGFQKAWKDSDAEFKLIESLIIAREKAGISQLELASKIGTKQPALSRLEHGGYRKATLETLIKIAAALDSELQIKLVPRKSL